MLALTSCGGQNTVYVPPPTEAGQLCAAHCGDAHEICRNDCTLGQRQCLNRAQAQALIDYESYMSQSFLHADAITRSERDFEHLDGCDIGFKTCSASCEAPYQVCYIKCGGKIELH